MNSIAAPSQSYMKTRLELEATRQRLIDQAYRAHKRGHQEDSSKLFDSVLELDRKLASA